ncbi:MAG: tetratricopeptide repeat protein [Cyanobacteria bacterium]|nr:tetratricopeptide repeat protein [Cyanobacteriota bacterium]MDA0865737.1 tetratricopeptide repeat protein [Cyanobacteriota bacterium]
MPKAFRSWLLCQQAKFAYRKGTNLIRKGSLKAAIACFTNALPHHPNPAECYVQRGLAHWQHKHREAAISDYNQAIALNPEHVIAYGNRGLVRYELGDTEGAIADWQTALRYRPHYATAHYNLGLHYAQQGDQRAAQTALTKAIAASPNLAEAYYHRGNVRDLLGDQAGALADWQLAIANDLSMDAVKAKLLNVRQTHHQERLAATVQGTLPAGIAVEVKHTDQQLTITLTRELGVPINYFTLPDQIRHSLLPLELGHVQRFRLLGHVGNQTQPEWNQQYNLYGGLPCPPSHWRSAIITTLLLCPPFGVLALVYAAQVKSLYQRGHYIAAKQASNIVRKLYLCSRTGMIAIASLLIVYLSFNLLAEIGHGTHTDIESLTSKPMQLVEAIFRNS